MFPFPITSQYLFLFFLNLQQRVIAVMAFKIFLTLFDIFCEPTYDTGIEPEFPHCGKINAIFITFFYSISNVLPVIV